MLMVLALLPSHFFHLHRLGIFQEITFFSRITGPFFSNLKLGKCLKRRQSFTNNYTFFKYWVKSSDYFLSIFASSRETRFSFNFEKLKKKWLILFFVHFIFCYSKLVSLLASFELRSMHVPDPSFWLKRKKQYRK